MSTLNVGKLNCTGNGVKLPAKTTGTLPTGETGLIVFNTSTGKANIYNGTAWDAVGGAAAGANTHVQYNSNGNFAGSSGLTYNGTNLVCGGNITANSDKSLKEKLPKWASVFIAMLVKRACETDGEVKDCPEVVAASNKYRQSQDCITGFISDKIIKDPTGSIGKRQLNDVFKEWFQMNYGNRKMPKLSEIEEIMIKKFGNRNTKSNKWIGIKFSEEEQVDELEDIEQND